MKGWGRLFRRRSTTTTALKEDYPTHSESDVTDDESRRREWENHLNRRATLAANDAGNLDDDLTNWDVQSDYDVNFPSDSSIIDAFREGKYENHNPDDHEFEKVLHNAVSYERKHSDDKHSSGGGRYSLYPNTSNRPKVPLVPARSPRVTERVRNLEQRHLDKRRASCVPHVNFADTDLDRHVNYDRYATWNNVGTKRKVKKNAKNRKRANAHELSFDASDDESKYTVNLTMEDLNHIIKKNITTAMKTIISVTSNVNKSNIRAVSPTESFSTETETMFSGSSTHSSELQPGLLQKHISRQLDMDRLKGNRRKSQAALTLPSNIETGLYKPAEGRRMSVVTTQCPMLSVTPPSPYMAHALQEPDTTYLHQASQHHQPVPQQHVPMQVPPPPPLPPHLQHSPQPQVTFNLPPQQPTGYTGISNQMQFQQSPMFTRQTFSNARPSIDLGETYPPMADISELAAENRFLRRHTLSSLENGGLLASKENSLESKVEQLNNVLNLLDKNINQAESNSKSGQPSETSSPKTDATTTQPEAPVTPIIPLGVNGLAPIASIADQIAALTKKKVKPLKPGQIKMSSCARAILVITNIAFLVIGGAVAALGVWLMMDPNIEHYFDMLNVDQTGTDFKMICYALIGVGAFILTIAFTGCCGTMKSSRFLLTVFLVLIVIIGIAEAGLGAIVFLHLDSPTAIPVLSAIFANVENNLRTTLKKSIVEKYDPLTMIGTTWNLVQIQLKCCGATGPDDYELSAWKNDTTNELTIPDECCVLISTEAEVPEPSNKLLCQLGTVGFFHGEGCYEVMLEWFKTNSTYIVAAGASSIAIEIVAFVSAVIICQKGKQTITSPNKDDQQHQQQQQQN